MPISQGQSDRNRERALRIAIVSYYLPSCSKIGVGYWVHAYANMLVERGHSVTVFSPCGSAEGALYGTKQVKLSGSLRTFRFALAIRELDLSSFDVLHAQGDDYWLWRGRSVAHIRTMHGSCLSEAIHIRGTKARLRMAGLGFGELLATVVADRTYCVSPETRRWMPWVRRVLPAGVDLESFSPGDNVRAERPTILFVGTFEGRKRGSMLLDVFQREIRRTVQDAQLWMVCEDAPEAPGVTVFGRVPHDRLVDLYRRAWVFCLPSSYEGFGIPYVEAMACGTPVVATPNPGSRYILDGGKFGVLTQRETLGRELADMLTNRARREHFAEAGLARCEMFSLAIIVGQYERAYREVMRLRSVNGGRVPPEEGLLDVG